MTKIKKSKNQIEQEAIKEKKAIKAIAKANTNPELFEEEPLKERVWQLKVGYDEYLAIADNNIDTELFVSYLRHCIKRNEVISLTIRGRVRCLDGDQEVIAKLGDRITRIRARDFHKHKNRAELKTYNFKTKKWEWQKFKETVMYSTRRRLKVTTCSGREVICDRKHGFPVYEGRDITHKFKFNEKFAEDLNSNDCLLLNTEGIEFTNSKFYEGYDLGFIVGCYLADGFIGNNTLTLTNNDIEIMRKVENIINRLFNVNTQWKTKKGENSSSFQCWSKLLFDFLKDRGTFAGDKCLKDEDFLSSRDYKIGLLDGYLSCECEISKKTGYIGVTSKSKRLIEDIAFLLSQFGYITFFGSRILKSGRYKGNKYYKLTISASQTYKLRKEIMVTRSNGMHKYPIRQNAKLQRRVIDNFMLDRVKSIEDLDVGLVFCVNIKNGNFLLANGLLSLNSGKSLSALSIALTISKFTGIPFIPSQHIKFSWEDYMTELNSNPNIPMHSVYVIDESENTGGMGSYSEVLAQQNVQRICAKRAIHSLSLVGDYSILNVNSTYNLVTRTRDFNNFETRLILYSVENSEEIPLCSIIVPIKKVLCDTVINKEKNLEGRDISGCVMCHKYNDEKLCPASTFLKSYEKAKDANIERVMKGGGATARQKLRETASIKLLDDERYFNAHSMQEMNALANSLLPKIANRQFTIEEVNEIVVLSRIFKREMQEKGLQPKAKVNLTQFDDKKTEIKEDKQTNLFQQDDTLDKCAEDFSKGIEKDLNKNLKKQENSKKPQPKSAFFNKKTIVFKEKQRGK